MKYLILAAVAAASLVLASPAVAQTPEPVDVCSNIPGVQLTPPANFHTIMVRYPETGLRSECVRNEATPTPSPVATPVVVTNTILIQCEGPFNYNAPYAQLTNTGFNPFAFNVLGLAVYPYAAGYNWPVPTLVTRTNGVVTNAIPNAPQCLPVAATPTPVATPAPQIVIVQQPAPTQAAVTQTISPPRTGDGGCLDAGGTYSKDGPIASCSFPVGNSGNVKVDDQKGSFESSHPQGYVNPGGSRPPGQQGE